MSVYWETFANGKLKLVGNWTNEAVNAFKTVEQAWEMEGDEKYGIWECDNLSESLSADFSAVLGSYDFSTHSSIEYNWYAFSDALNSIDVWTRAWIKDTPKRNGIPIHPLSTEQYDLLLKLMYDNDLKINIKFSERGDCEGESSEYDYTGSFTSDGNKLIYNTLSSVEKIYTWKDYGKAALYGAVDFFMTLVEDADEPKIRKWVKKTITPTEIFEDFDECNFDDWINNLFWQTPFEEEALEDFVDKFSPSTNTWEKFFERVKDELDWLTNDDPQFWEDYTDEELAEKYKWKVNLETGCVSYSPQSYSYTTISITNYKSLRTRYNWRDNFPFDIHHWHDVVRIAFSRDVVIRLKSDGTVVSTDYLDNFLDELDNWSDMVAVAAGWEHVVGVKANGRVKAYGNWSSGDDACLNVKNWRNITAIAAGAYHTVGLKKNGTVLATGNNQYGQCNVETWKDIIAIAAGGAQTFGVKADGTVIHITPEPDKFDTNNWHDIIAIDCGEMFAVALNRDGTVVATGHVVLEEEEDREKELSTWVDIVAIAAGGWHTLGLKADGTVVASGGNNMGQCDVETWCDIVAIAAGHSLSFGIKSDGTVVVAGKYFNPNAEDEDSDDDEEDWDDDDSDDDWDDEDCNDEEPEEGYKEPEYPTEDITSLDFEGKKFVLTGEFQNCNESRDEIKELIEQKGGKCTDAVSGKTNFLVLGDFEEIGARKVEQALEQQKKGNDIKIITESTLFKFL